MKIKSNNKAIFKIFSLALIISISLAVGFFSNKFLPNNKTDLISPFVSLQKSVSLPLLKYTIPNLRSREYNSSKIKIENLISKENKYNSYLFSYTTLGKKMTGQLNIPDSITTSPTQKHSIIVMIRGYVPQEIYKTGVGTKNAASVLANNGYITIAPDFFGFGDSDPEPEDTWQTRFEKPVIIIELIKSLEKTGIPTIKDNKNFKIDNIGIWAHSNGGQIALTTLEILDKKIPTTLWAPVTAPFPYSILYFGDELEDEGKSQRKWLAMFEEKYDVFDFSLTQHLNFMQGPVQIQHGSADDAALIYWSEEFIKKIEAENSRRASLKKEIESNKKDATNSAKTSNKNAQNLEDIEIIFHKYANTNHNMVPNWNKAINRDLEFFKKYF